MDHIWRFKKMLVCCSSYCPFGKVGWVGGYAFYVVVAMVAIALPSKHIILLRSGRRRGTVGGETLWICLTVGYST